MSSPEPSQESVGCFVEELANPSDPPTNVRTTSSTEYFKSQGFTISSSTSWSKNSSMSSTGTNTNNVPQRKANILETSVLQQNVDEANSQSRSPTQGDLTLCGLATGVVDCGLRHKLPCVIFGDAYPWWLA
ncbi:unnamed protein product [Cylindrotheca closterium]|uniref:Uncharacterized protein n=1 Tax=Cylindrotheca closterium TaxID=2856 RepID=A0AAD2FJ97_9STRA|nr:unnamed protein product [Cylindrotheca closterium]